MMEPSGGDPAGARVIGTRVLRPSVGEGAAIARVRVAPDGRRIAFARVDKDEAAPGAAGIYVQDGEGEPTQILACGGLLPVDIAWSPDGSMLAYLLSEGSEVGSRRAVGWASASSPGQRGTLGADAFAWGHDGASIFAFSAAGRTIAARALAAEVAEPVGHAIDAGDPAFPPRIAAARGGSHVALAVRSTFDDCSSVWIYAKEEERYATSLLTDIPGTDAFVCPFFSPKGRSVALFIAHRAEERSGIVVFRGMRGGGEIIYESELVDAAEPPAWAPSGSAIAFMQAVEAPEPEGATRYRAALLHFEKSAITPVGEAMERPATPRFLAPNVLALDGGSEARVISLDAPP